eukprot:TRINITY_DN5294_c0_g6_i1.p1 TRINITY_DN5294_c0_g6~~TRINITY_DN5294_c0_g6_i1.p1  ORF type:complete len:271 (+),score=31.15 TRINITY_DN5294_c0_g6_i1:60-872(+)
MDLYTELSEEVSAVLESQRFSDLMWSVIFPLVALLAVIHLVLIITCKIVWPNNKDHWNLADSIFCIPFYSYLSYLAIANSNECIWSVEGRWVLYTPKAYLFFSLYVARNLFHIPYMFVVDMKMSFRLVMILHHALSSFCFFGGLFTTRMSCFGLLDGVCEVTTVFLSVICLFKDLQWDKWLPGVHVFSGLSLWFTYIVTRLCLFPFWLYQYYQDVVQFPELTWEQATFIEKYVYPVTNVVLLVLSVKWMVAIHRGMIKALKADKKEEKIE